MTHSMRHFQNLNRLAVRAFSTTARRMENKVPLYQKLYQADNGLPVHIKGGTADVLLYRFTMGITFAGTGYALFLFLVAFHPGDK